MKKPIKLLIILLGVLTPYIVKARNIPVNGVVLSKNSKAPLPGAVVLVKGTYKGVTSNEKGEFFIEVPEGESLVISFIGFESQTLNIVKESFLQIELDEHHNQLNEVVITAMGISKEKKSLGYSVQEINSEAISTVPESNLVNSLAGKIAGVNITNSQGSMGSSRIIIRGETSIAGNNQPLFVVDGVPVDNSRLSNDGASRDFANAISDINSQDIESISVLKGPNAAALYGSRAASGVILIKTKNGNNLDKLRINIYSKTTFENPLILPNYQNKYGQGSSGQFYYVDGKGGGINDGVDESWGPPMDGRLIPQFFSNGEAVPFVPSPDNVKDFFETGYTINNGISIADSDDKFAYRFSYNNNNQNGILPNTDLKKNSFNVNSSYKILPQLEISTSVNYINTNSDNLPAAYGSRATSPMLQFAWFGRQVDTNLLKDYYDEDGNMVNWNNSYFSNFYFIAEENTVSLRRNRIIGNINLNYKISENLNANFRIGNDYYNDRRKIKVAYGTNGTPFGSYQEVGYTVNEKNTELTINYNSKISENFSIDILGGGNIQDNFYEENDQKAPKLAVKDVYSLTNSRDPLISSNYYSQQRKNSLFASGQLGYKRYAFINLTARNDWSSTLPKNNNSYFYPSANASIIISELFKSNNRFLSFLKIRGGWSQVGSDADPYQLLDTYPFNSPFGAYPLLTVTDASLNEDLKPETTSSTEAGLEIGLFNNNLKIDFSVYNTLSKDQILNVNVSPSTGYTSKLLNAGQIRNSGFETQLNFSPVKINNGLTWDVWTNFSINKSEVLELDKEGLLTAYQIGSGRNVQVLAAIGKPYGSLYGTAFKRNSSGEIIVTENGVPDTDPNNKFMGSFQPDWIAGITNTLSYKNINLSFLVDAKIGGAIYNGTYSTSIYTGVLNETLQGRDEENGGLPYYYPEDLKTEKPVQLDNHTSSTPNNEIVYHDGMIFDGVNADGTKNTTIVSAQNYWKSFRNIAEANIFDASFVKLRELSIGYNLPIHWAGAIAADKINISLIGRNLWIIHKNTPGIDPETANNSGNAQGLENLSPPTTRSYGFSVNLTF